jgi:hypothetical protein
VQTKWTVLMSPVPVSIGFPWLLPLAQCVGLLRLEDGDLVLEYQTKDALLGILKAHVREARIPRDMLVSLTIRKQGLFGCNTKVVIHTTRMQPVPGTEIPGMTQGRLVLDVAREDVPAAEKLVADLGLDGPRSSVAERQAAACRSQPLRDFPLQSADQTEGPKENDKDHRTEE